MRIQRVSIKEFKNLKGFDCIFSGSNTAAFIGSNGSGKSNLLEVITRAFSNAQNVACSKPLPLISPKERPDLQDCVIEYSVADTNYTLKYNCDVGGLFLNADPALNNPIREKIEIWCDDKVLPQSEVKKALPDIVLIYYAGETQRQKGLAETTYDTVYERRLIRAKTSDLPGLRYLDCYDTGDLTLLLAAASAYQGDYYRELIDLLDCGEIVPKFSLILRKPPKGKGTADTYWGATGFVKHFLDDLRKGVSATRDLDSQYFMFFNNSIELKKVSANEFDLFSKLKALKYYGYLDHVGIEFTKRDGAHFSALRLSEGEKQLSLLLLLTAFTAKNEALYLFDEFDTYLHLNWQKAFSQMLHATDVAGQMVITTHSPATVAGMQRKDVFIMHDGRCKNVPSETYNRSLDEIMEEHMLVSMRPAKYNDLVQEFREAVMLGSKDLAEEALIRIREIVGESDPFFITAKIALNRMS